MKHPERVADYLEHIVVASSRAVDYVRDADNFDYFHAGYAHSRCGCSQH